MTEYVAELLTTILQALDRAGVQGMDKAELKALLGVSKNRTETLLRPLLADGLVYAFRQHKIKRAPNRYYIASVCKSDVAQ